MPSIKTRIALVSSLALAAVAPQAVAHPNMPGDTKAVPHGTYEDHGFDRPMRFPALPDGSVIVSADLHTHSVFSDGMVWPAVRVEEADRDGLDALAFTEHLEHQPKAADIPNPDRNRAYQIGVKEAEAKGIKAVMLISGAEITRSMPPGHVNAVFLTDANKLRVDDAEAAIKAANDQGGFVFWNHPNWLPQAPDGVARILPFHEKLIREKQLHGVEVANGTLDGYSDHALGIALKYNLTVLGTSDIHGLIDWTHSGGHGKHRPLTLVLARARTPEALKEALFAGRTVAFNNDDLIGKAEHVEQVFRACLTLAPKAYQPKSSVLAVDLVNRCPLAFTLENKGLRTFHDVSDLVRVPRYGTTSVMVRMNDETRTLVLDLAVLNTRVRPREHLTASLRADVSSIPRP
jgi:3',5'-nucleoside bisphosphate phosphatase